MEDQNINITPIEGIGIDISTETYNIDIKDENIVIEKKVEENTILIQETPDISLELKKEPDNVLNLEGEVIKIDANYPQAMEAARIATEKAEEAKEVVEGFDDHAASKITEYDSNASDKIAAYNANAVEKTNAFNSNATSKTTAFNENASSKTGEYNSNATEKVSDFNTNATNKTNTFNQNATDKTTAFNNNASEKTTAFNENYTEKKAIIDSQVQLAKDWATKTDGKVDGEDYSAKYYAQSILPIASDITTVAGIASDVTTVSFISSDVTSVADNATDISTVADSISDVNSVGSNIAKVTAVADDLTNIDAVNANKTNIDTVASISSDVSSVANNNTDISTVASDIINVNSVASNLTNIDAVASNASNINAVAGDLTNINAVANDLTNIDNASSYANLAKDWATKTNGTVDGSEYSAKYYAEYTESMLSTKADKATTLAGYGITDAYTKTEVDTALSAKADKATTLAGYGITNAYTKTEVDTALSGKQNSLDTTQMAAVNSGANTTNIGQIATNTSDIGTINGKIPSAASTSNQLADKNYVDTADNNLQSQIDAIVASSDVFDIVGTYAELQAYDISTVPVNDIIKVLVDSTHSNAATYYRCVESGGVKSWSYIGSEGAYYTKSETDTLLQAKQDEITSSNKLSADLVDDTSSTNKFVTSSDISTWNAKQNALTKGAGIDITSDTISNSGVRSVSTGATNGTISVNTNGTSAEVAVYGLGSAAYTASTAYDASGSANTAETNAKNYADSLASNYATAAQGAKADTALQPADLIGYATETWVGNQGYITGISSGDVTTALGYTPYDSSNPSGYTSNVGTVTSVNNTSPDGNGNVTLSIPAAQVNSDWNANSGVAEILNKPTLGTMASESASDYTKTSGLATVATSGSYNDLSNKPTIPTVDQTYSSSSTNAQSGMAVAEAIAGFSGANTNLSNLTSQGQNIANWSSNVTNCITEIPQDIKLELSGTTLTSKAGSKVYIPNGKIGDTLNFTEVTLSSDLTFSTWGSASTDLMMFYNNGALVGYSTGIYSGDTQPTTAGLWYDTANNYMKYSSNGTSWAISNHALPLGLVGRSSGTPTAIHQVFNGFGYIGSTVFALPNVKGLIPNGRNADGSLKNIEFTVSNIILRTFTTQTLNYVDWGINPSMNPIIGIGTGIFYDENSNIVIESGSGNDWNRCIFGKGTVSSGVISNFSIKTPFHALDYSDSSTISGWSMPSSRYIDLTLGASGANYTAPANGWVVCRRTSTAVGQVLQITNAYGSEYQFYIQSGKASGIVGGCLPVKKGDIFVVGYTLGSSTNQIFRFIYAEGEE